MHDDDSKRRWQEQRQEYDKILDQINKAEAGLRQPRREIPYTFTGCLPILSAIAMSWIGVLAAIYLVVGPC